MAPQVSLFILASVLISVIAQDPIVSITTTNPDTRSGIIEAVRDTDVTMSCRVENKQPEKAVRWERWEYDAEGHASLDTTISIDTAVEDNIKYSVEKPTSFTWRLRIKAIQVGDEGVYVCFVFTTIDNRKQDSRIVLVAIRPYLNFEQTSWDTTVNQGDNVDLKCNATARPNPTIAWTRLGGALLPIGKEIHFETLLAIRSTQPSDRGTYRCRAYNVISGEVQQVTRDVQLTVRFSPIVRPLHREVWQAEGCYRIELQCLIEANPLPRREDLRWVKGFSTISSSIGRYEIKVIEGAFNRLQYELIISGVEANDFGSYQCMITNTEGSGSAVVQLREADEPQPSMKLGQIITCAACHTQVTIATLITCLLFVFFHKL